jgi:hypothetical protein
MIEQADPVGTALRREQRGFIEHTVSWALALLVEERRQVIVEARTLARHLRQPHDGLRGLTHFSADAWDEIARRVEAEGHTLVVDRP